MTGAAGLWLAAAAAWGPLAGPFCLMTLGWLVGIIGGRWWLRNHDAIRAARERREAEALAALADRARKAEWHRLAARVGLRGSHLLGAELNNNGETWTIDTYSAGKLASQVSCATLAERLAGELGKRKSRIEVTPDPEWPYRLLITVRERDPWQGGTAAGVIWHPWASGELDPRRRMPIWCPRCRPSVIRSYSARTRKPAPRCRYRCGRRTAGSGC